MPGSQSIPHPTDPALAILERVERDGVPRRAAYGADALVSSQFRLKGERVLSFLVIDCL
jgi:hypothetical protein